MAEEPKDLTPELAAIRDALKGVPEAMESVKQMAVDQEAMQKRLADFEAQASKYVAREDVDDRSNTEKAKDGEFHIGAYYRGLGIKAMGGDFYRGCSEYTVKGSKDWKDAGFTAEVVKAMSTTVGSGGYMAPENWITSQFVDILRPKLVTIGAGIDRTYTNLSNADNKIGRLATGGTAYWVAENGTISAADGTDEQISLTPHKAACITKASSELMKMSNPNIGSIMVNDQTNKLAAIVDLAVLEGAGSSNQPTGIKTAVSTNSVTTSGAMTWAKLEEFLRKVATSNYPGIRPVWFMHPRTYSSIRQITVSEYPQFVGTPLNQPMGADLAGRQLLGYPVFQSSQMTITGGSGSDGVVLFGDASEVGLADWGPPSFFASTEADTAFAADQIWFRALWMVDVFMKHEASWCKCTDTTS